MDGPDTILVYNRQCHSKEGGGGAARPIPSIHLTPTRPLSSPPSIHIPQVCRCVYPARSSHTSELQPGHVHDGRAAVGIVGGVKGIRISWWPFLVDTGRLYVVGLQTGSCHGHSDGQSAHKPIFARDSSWPPLSSKQGSECLPYSRLLRAVHSLYSVVLRE